MITGSIERVGGAAGGTDGATGGVIAPGAGG